MAALGLGLMMNLPAAAQNASFPDSARTIVAIVPFSAGGPTDRVAREAALIMGRSLGAKVVVENRAGAGGTIGAQAVARARNDGYTILIHNMAMATAPSLYRKLGFDPLLDFSPIGELVDVPMVLVANKSLGITTLDQLVSHVNRSGAQTSFGNAGPGSASHLCGLIFFSALKRNDVQMVPFKGSAPALTDLVGGHTQLGCDQTTNLAGHLIAKSIHPIAAMQDQRIKAFPDIPTLHEQGMRDTSIRVWHGVFAPKDTPTHIVNAYANALREVVADEKFKQSMVEVGAEAVSLERASQESLRQHLKSEMAVWSSVIRKSGYAID